MGDKYGLGKYRTPFGKWLDKVGKTSIKFAGESGVHRNTIDALAGQKGYGARKTTLDKILKAAKKIDPEATYEKLFPPL